MIRNCPLPLRRLPLMLGLALATPLALAQQADEVTVTTEETITVQPAETMQADTGTAGQAADSRDATLQAVHIRAVVSEGYRPVTVKAGTFRGASVMDVPSTVNVVTSKVLEAQAATGLYDAVKNTAGVTRQQNGGDTWDQLVIRGMEVQNRTNYRLNSSMPIMNFSQVPMENKARVEVLKGASALYYGFTAPSGIVNYVTKRAGLHPVTSVGLRFDSNGTAGSSTKGLSAYTSETLGSGPGAITLNFSGSTPVGVVSVGAAGQERRIQNVAAGLLSNTSTDAVNGSQLYAVAQVAYNATTEAKAANSTANAARHLVSGITLVFIVL